MKIQVLGSGCANCENLHKIVTLAVKKLKLDIEVEYISGIKGTQKIIELGAMSSPVLAINNQIALTGFTKDLEKIEKIITCYK